MTDLQDMVATGITAFGGHVERMGSTLRVTLDGRSAIIDTQDLADHLLGLQGELEGAAISAYVGGVHAAFESPNVRARRHPGASVGGTAADESQQNCLVPILPMSFVEVAGRLVPMVRRHAFGLGFRETSGRVVWQESFGDSASLSVLHCVLLDQGDLVLTQAQVEAWGVSTDRITSAARSILYHKSWAGGLESFADEVSCYRVGDGHDAARAVSLCDLQFARTRAGVVFAVPSRDLLLVIDRASPSKIAPFAQLVREAFDSAEHPLSPELFTHDDDRMIIVAR